MMTDQHHDPFFDPFSPEPQVPATPPMPPAPTDLPPAPVPAAAPTREARASKARARVSPATVFLGSYAFVGIAAVLLATAIATLVALSDFRAQRGGVSGPVLVAVAAVLVIVAAVVVWLAVLDDRGRGWARTATWVVCGLAVCAALAIFVVDPGASVAWFAQLLRLAAVAMFLVSALSAVLLALPQSNAHFQRVVRPEHVAAQPISQPAASYTPAPEPPADESDHDPFS
jgi:hypothetical protein